MAHLVATPHSELMPEYTRGVYVLTQISACGAVFPDELKRTKVLAHPLKPNKIFPD